MLSDPERRFSGSAWRFDRLWAAFDAACPSVIAIHRPPPDIGGGEALASSGTCPTTRSDLNIIYLQYNICDIY